MGVGIQAIIFLGNRPNLNCICGVYFMSDSLSSVCGHSVHFATFTILRFSKDYYSHTFHPISTKRYIKYGNPGGGGITFLATCQILKTYGTLKIKVTPTTLYIAISHKPIMVSPGKGSRRASRPLCYFFYSY